MSKFLDAQISQNIKENGGIAIALATTPQLFGTLGLHSGDAGPNLRVQFTATACVSAIANVAVPIRISIYRGTGANAVLVYSAVDSPVAVSGVGALNNRIITITGADYRPPNPGLLVYQAFINLEGAVAVSATRTGPECFNAAAYSD